VLHRDINNSNNSSYYCSSANAGSYRVLVVFDSSESPAQHEDECNNYDISDLCSDDSTDDELEPRKKLPAWADG